MKRVSLPIAVLAGGLLPVSYLLTPAEKAAPQYGYVDLQRVFAADERLNKDLQTIKARFKEYQDREIKQLVDEASELKAKRDSVPDRQTADYVKAVAAFSAKEAELKDYARGVQGLLEGEADQRNLEAYERYRKIIAELAEKKGLEAVFRITDPEAANKDAAARMRAAELGMVLYRDKKLDITEEVIALLKTSK